MAEEAGQATLSIERSTNERKRHTIKDRRIISVSFCHGLMMWALPHPIPSWMDVGRHCLGGACPGLGVLKREGEDHVTVEGGGGGTISMFLCQSAARKSDFKT